MTAWTKRARPLLRDLDKVPWDKLHHAYGPAVDVPAQLRALADEGLDGKRYDRVTWELWGNVFHQGTRWAVSAKTVPFFVELLEKGPRRKKQIVFLLTYLEHLAIGYPHFPSVIDFDKHFAAVKGDANPARDDEFGIYERDCFAAVEAHVAAYVPFLAHDDDAVALHALSLVATFPRKADVSLPAIRALQSSSNAVRAGNALVADALLAHDAVLPEAEARLSSPQPLRTFAALACVVADAERASTDAVAALLEPTPDAKSAFADDLGSAIGRVLARLPDRHRERAVDAVCAQLANAPEGTRLDLTSSLLRLALPDGAPERARGLGAAARKACEHVRDHAPFMIANMHFGNMSELARGFRLPDSKEKLAEWLATV